MKKLYMILAFLSIQNYVISQNLGVGRVEVEGKIIVESADIEGITIFNKMTNEGAVTDVDGIFNIKVKLNDKLEIRSLQFQNFDVIVNDAILDSRKMKVFLIEEVNKLDEVLVTTGNLSGDIDTDLSKVETFNPKLDALYFGIKRSDEYDFKADPRTEVVNRSMHSQSEPAFINGLNIKNVVDQLLLPLFISKAQEKDKLDVPEVPIETIRYYMGAEFLQENFDIPEDRVNDFVNYVESSDFDYTLLKYGREMEFLEVLNVKSKQFLNETVEKN